MERSRRMILSTLLLAGGIVSYSATITHTPEATTFTETTEAGTIEIVFRKCMANELFTFYQVKLDGKEVNSARYSDNIGPFLVTGQGWIGGNHLSDSGKKTARTVDVSIRVDGQTVSEGTQQASVMEALVSNELYMPDGTTFAIETIRYVVAGNSIEVWADHEFKIATEVVVDRYYGMQSMFVGESEILAPGGKKYNKWLGIVPGGSANSINIKSYEAPKFSVFVEKSANGYQATYLTREGLGKRGKVGVEDMVFIGNSYEKSYHKTIGSAKVRPGESTQWHGVYSWFAQPCSDTFGTSDDKPTFTYPAYMGGEAMTMTIDDNGTVTSVRQSGVPTVSDNERCNCGAEYYDLSGIRLASPAGGQVCVKRTNSETIKIIVK